MGNYPTKVITSGRGGEILTSAKAGVDSINISNADIDELRSRFKRLQYDTNRSINVIREEVKDTIEGKFVEIQLKLMQSKPAKESVEKKNPYRKNSKSRTRESISFGYDK